MKFNMKDLNPGTWFLFNEADAADGRICLRVLNGARLAEVKAESVTITAEYRNNQRFEVQDIDHVKRDALIWDYCIVDWENLTDDDDVPIECTPENKVALMNGHVSFSVFVETCLNQLNADMETISEMSEKN